MGPDATYWRLNNNKGAFIKCLNAESCLGAVLSDVQKTDIPNMECGKLSLSADDYDGSFCVTGWCHKNYMGILCSKCKPGFAKSTAAGDCVSCSSNAMYYVIIVGVLIVAVCFLAFVIRNAINVKKEGSEYNKSSILVKILMNYFQLISIVSNFKFKWPVTMNTTFAIQNQIANSIGSVFNFDCLVK